MSESVLHVIDVKITVISPHLVTKTQHQPSLLINLMWWMNEREKDFTSSFSPAEGNDFLLALHTWKIISKLFIYVWKKPLGILWPAIQTAANASKCLIAQCSLPAWTAVEKWETPVNLYNAQNKWCHSKNSLKHKTEPSVRRNLNVSVCGRTWCYGWLSRNKLCLLP